MKPGSAGPANTSWGLFTPCGVVLLASAVALGQVPPAPPPERGSTPHPTSSEVDAQMREGQALLERGALGPAMEVLERALARMEAEGNPANEARCRNLIGDVADRQGELDRGAQEHSRALALAQRAGDRRLEARILADTGAALWRRAAYSQALALLDRAAGLQEELGLPMDRARTLVLIGRVHFKEGDYPRALDFHTRALAMQEAAGDRAGAAVTLEDIGDVHLELQAYSLAVDDFRRSLALREALGDTAGQSWILTVRGTAYLVQGAFADAELDFLRALAVAEKADDDAGRAQALYHLGLVHLRTGEHQRAVTSLSTAARLHELLGDHRAMAWDLEHLGLARHRAGDHAGALQHYSQALAVREAIQDLRGLASTLDALGLVQEAMGDLHGALTTYRRALSLGEELHLPYVCLTLGRLGRVQASQPSRAAQARDHGRRGVERARLLDSRGLVWKALYHAAQIERRLGDREAALHALEESIAVIEALRADAVDSGESGAGFLDDKQAVFADAIALYFEAGREEAALECAERARDRAFLDLTAPCRARREAKQAPTSPPDSASRPTTRGTATSAARRVDGLGSAAPVESRLAFLTRARAAARLRDATLVEYFAGGDFLCLWVMSPSGRLAGTTVPYVRQDLDALLEAARRQLQQTGSSNLPPSSGDPWRRLHELLVEPVVRLLPADPDALVLLAPHGPLWALPFGCLRDRSGQQLVERHTLAYMPSMGALAPRAPVASRRMSRTLIVGNPTMPELPEVGLLSALPAAEREAVEVAAVLNERHVTLLTGARASERAVRSLAPRHAWLHLATHGLIRDDMPLDSMLVLGADGTVADADGRLTAREILDLDLDAELVVLSGCDTGRGRITGDGVVGLGRAFLSAGARAVLVSLARVEDEAACGLMLHFYRELVRNGGNQATALRSAQLAAITQPPARWATFVLIVGD